MNKIFFDTFILSRIAWSNDPNVDIRAQWDSFIQTMEKIYPDFSEKDFTWLHSSLLMLELIGLGSIRDEALKKGPYYAFESNPLRTMANAHANEWQKFKANPELFVKHIAERIEKFIRTQLTKRNLYRQTLQFTRKYPCHAHAHFIMGKIKTWAKDIKDNDSGAYEKFVRDILWDTIFRYPSINIRTIAVKTRLNAMMFWAAALGELYREYYAEYIQDESLECSTLGLFSEIDATGYAHNNSTDNTAYNRIVRQWDDMVDAESIHLALVGKRISLEANEPVIVVIADEQEDVERRLECLYKNLTEMSKKGLGINLCPGRIIILSQQSMKLVDIIDVENFINKLESVKKP